MDRKLLFGLFLMVIGISFIYNKVTYKNETYAYETKEHPLVRIYYLDKENDEIILKDEKSTFQVIDSNNQIITSFETYIGNEYTEISILDIGKYTIRQIKTSDNYNHYPDEEIYVENMDPTNIYIMATKSITPKIAISLVDIKTNKLLDKAEFHLLKDKELIGTCTTTKGYCYINDIKSGTYTLENVVSASGYIAIDNIEVIVKEEKTKYLNLSAEATKLIISTFDNNDRVVNNGYYQIYDLMDNLIYDLKELKYVENIPIGSYYLKETITPDGYKSIKDKIRFDIKNTNEEQKLNIYYQKLEPNNDFIDLFAIIGIIFFIIGLIYLGLYYLKHKINKIENTNNGD